MSFSNGLYGHVAIVTKVTENSIEIIQQNEKITRQVLKLVIRNHHFFVGSSVKPTVWLRKAE
ncbi:CHAP domain-containing protein [Desulfosporosinus sp. FKB]|uniref:CHAP domain-containing protein n=1 Tax=Desulfosporosinus sp. FKB TaxID=1969835 RepID=UPI001FA839C6|nr:CHAP domain-containing protein [Desulfosporosinus sp. FKB]